MMNRWYGRRRWIYSGLAALLLLDAVIYLGWIHRPDVLPLESPAPLASLEREVSEQAAEVARLQQVREQAPQLGPRLEKFVKQRFWTERAGFSRVAGELDEAASEAGVRLTQVSYKSQAEGAQPELVRVEIGTGVEGGYANLLRYLDALERSPRIYVIDELSVTGAQGGLVRLEMRLTTFFQRGRT